ncbi:MAG: decaprenyl-phosphate phosphoribosyltransferase [Planctomycetes bacterium]|nr:decaprenyl-phosphate phosphoribosyltransferase [Planctomycetota bacterium]
MSSLSALVRALRPQQWSKNVFVLAAFVFARGEHGGSLIAWGDDARRTLFALIGFCLGASAIYLVNDVLDVESDRKHPEKCRRPIAAGELSIALALGTALALLAAAVALGLAAGGEPLAVAWVLGAYLVLNLLYSLRLKHVVLVDAFCIAAGFLLRVKAGALAAGAPVSHWLMLCTLFLALFLALAKRRAESELLGEGRGEHRAILLEYDTRFLDQMLGVLAACAIVTYTMYTVSPETVAKFARGAELVYTVPFVVFGLARYLLLVHTQKGGGNPTRMFLGGDLLFGLNTLGWMATVLWCVAQRH